MVKIESFWWQKGRHKSKFGGSGEKNFSRKFPKKYLNQVHGHEFGQK